MKNDREFYENKIYAICVFILLIICGFCMSGGFLFSALTDPDPNIRALSFIPILMLLFCFYLCICFFKSITNPNPYVIVDSRGIQYKGSFFEVGNVQEIFLWQNIKELSIEPAPPRGRVCGLKLSLDKRIKWILLHTMSDKEQELFIKSIKKYKEVQDKRYLHVGF